MTKSKDMELILSGIMKEILEQVHLMFASEMGINAKAGFNTLKMSSLDRDVKGTLNGEEIDIEFPQYIVYIEWTRPEKYKDPPPYGSILKWLKEKHITPTAGNIKTVEQLAWAFRYAIWRDGWEARVITGLNRDYTGESPLDKWIDKQWETKWGDELYDIITKELDKYFKD